MNKDSQVVHSGLQVEPSSGALVPAIHTATTFERAEEGDYPLGHDYSRTSNPNRTQLEVCLAELEGGEQAITYPSGMAAIFAVFSSLTPGDHVLVPNDAYSGLGKVLRSHFMAWGLDVEFIDMARLEELEHHLRPDTRLIWTETPSNPLLVMTDLQATCKLAAEVRALVACDNTFATPLGQRPLELGVDLVMHSCTKYLAGHSDLMGGAVVVRSGCALTPGLRDMQTLAGLVLSPMDCWMIRRGILTLSARMQRHCDNAMAVATALQDHPALIDLHYPGLPSDPGHALASRQMHLFGGMLSMVVQGGQDNAFGVANGLRLIKRATSLGGPETLIEHRASIEGEHSVSPVGLLRLSIGLEDPNDLINDLRQSLDALGPTS